MTQVADVMTRGVRTMAPDNTMFEAAQAMQALDAAKAGSDVAGEALEDISEPAQPTRAVDGPA